MKRKFNIIYISSVLLLIGVLYFNARIIDPTRKLNRLVELNYFILVHTGEGSGDDDCTFENVNISDEEARYNICKQALVDLAVELHNAGMKAVFQFHGGFFELLNADDDFSFNNDIINFGHEIGMHHHTECLKEVDPDNCSSDNPIHTWAKIGELNASEQDVVTTEQSMTRFSSIHGLLVGEGFQPISYCGWGSVSNLKDEASDPSSNLFSYLLENEGVFAVTSTGEVPINWEAINSQDELNCGFPYATTPSNQYVNVHPVRFGESNLFYFDSPAFKFGDRATDADAEKSILNKVFDCVAYRANSPGYKDQIFTWSATTHLHNVIDGDIEGGIYGGVDKAISDLTTLKNHMQLKTIREKKVIVKYRTLEEIMALMENYSDYEFDLRE